ncbi:hypothetical protein LshimejAT787_0202010 [Lyophyllum shimeji]|uniref:Uncharacterized protein n=1 Tax=Lyophyllum shimeji TaxID=47721 RepID=A0A9P3PFQ8_LYOSH|nr:hypothetical protein LshimejAT787_0202010 [Lyophyllum shimeji]
MCQTSGLHEDGSFSVRRRALITVTADDPSVIAIRFKKRKSNRGHRSGGLFLALIQGLIVEGLDASRSLFVFRDHFKSRGWRDR